MSVHSTMESGRAPLFSTGFFPTPGAALRAQAEAIGESEALAFPESGGRLTFAGWYEQSTAVARGLVDLGVRPGSHVALLAESRVEWPVAQVGIALAGATFVPLNTHYRIDDLRYALVQSRSEVIILSERFRSNAYLEMVRKLRDELPLLREIIVLDGSGPEHSFDDLLAAGKASTTILPDVESLAIASLQYTSGTTGFPKGALLTHAGMMRNAWETSGRLGIRQGDRWTSIIQLFHCAGCIMCILGALQRGAAYIGVCAFDAEAMLRLIEAEQCTAMSGVPTSYLAMLQHPARSRYDISSLRTGTCGGADCNPDVLKECAAAFPQPHLVQLYGQTEASTIISCPAFDDPERFDTAGQPLPGYDVRVTDPDTRAQLPDGEVGQIEVRGDMVMHGYFERPDETEATIDADGWLQTGDLGLLTTGGRVVMAGGRLRDMIIRGGENIYPVEIENVLIQHPAVGEVAVFAAKDSYYGEVPVAAIRLDAPVTSAELAEFCHARIARFKVPATFCSVEQFPLTASGKIRKRELQEQFAGKSMDVMS